MFKKIVTILILVVIIYILLYLKEITEGLQNIGTGNENDPIAVKSGNEQGSIAYLTMHDKITTDPTTSDLNSSDPHDSALINALNETDTIYSWEDLKSNLTSSDDTIKDLSYFNNVSSIYTGYRYKTN